VDRHFVVALRLSEHLEYFHKFRYDFHCDSCHVGFSDRANFDSHVKSCTGPGSRKLQIHCTPCNADFYSINALKRHEEESHRDVPFYVKPAMRVFKKGVFAFPKDFVKKPELFVQPETRKRPLGEIASPDAPKKKSAAVVAKKPSVGGAGKYPCARCTEVFTNIKSFRKHCNSAHGTTAKQSVAVTPVSKSSGHFPCEVCQKVLLTKKGHRNHMKSSHGLVADVKKAGASRPSEGTRREDSDVDGSQATSSASRGKPILWRCKHCEFEGIEYAMRQHRKSAHPDLKR
jgi:uncharacterized C2H2 Zn-finger protein